MTYFLSSRPEWGDPTAHMWSRQTKANNLQTSMKSLDKVAQPGQGFLCLGDLWGEELP